MTPHVHISLVCVPTFAAPFPNLVFYSPLVVLSFILRVGTEIASSMVFTLGSTLPALAVTWLAFQILQICYNLFVHPLKKFPGPRAAAASTWWKAYVECFKQESQIHAIMKLHEKYGETSCMMILWVWSLISASC